jgi:hypothetical protein
MTPGGKRSYALAYGAVWDLHRVLLVITCFYPVVSSVLYPLKPLFYRTGSWFRTGYLLDTLSMF